MSSELEQSGLRPQLTDSVSISKNESAPMQAATRYERYKVLTRKLAHHRSGTGEAMTREERGELREITEYRKALAISDVDKLAPVWN